MSGWLSRQKLKIAGRGAGAVLIVVLVVTMFAAEITRVFVSESAVPPVPLPGGVDIRYSDRLVAIIGQGTPSRRARAVTLGSLILVSRHFDGLSERERSHLIRHELVHVRQRDRYGPFYLPLYGALYLIHGYTDHPFEQEAVREMETVENGDS